MAAHRQRFLSVFKQQIQTATYKTIMNQFIFGKLLSKIEMNIFWREIWLIEYTEQKGEYTQYRNVLLI